MGHQSGGHPANPLIGADQGFARRPFAFEFLFIRFLFRLGDPLELGIDSLKPGLAQFDSRQAAFVIDAHRRAVLNGARDIVDVDIIAENGGGIFIMAFDGGAGETDKRGMGQGVVEVTGKAVDEIVLTAVGLKILDIKAFKRIAEVLSIIYAQ